MPLKDRPGDQRLPTIHEGKPDVQSALIADIEVRRAIGIERYGTALQTFNHRDALLDAYEESVDKTMYLKQIILEEDERVAVLRAHQPFMVAGYDEVMCGNHHNADEPPRWPCDEVKRVYPTVYGD